MALDEQKKRLIKEREQLLIKILSASAIELLTESAKTLKDKGYRLQPCGLEQLAMRIRHIREINDDIDTCDGMALPLKSIGAWKPSDEITEQNQREAEQIVSDELNDYAREKGRM